MTGHQTIRLIAGRHSSPERGACVMEVASRLAGEPFTDEPACVCPVIAEFLRTYNDEIDFKRRQDLYEYASLVVQTREGPKVERKRANLCLDWRLKTAAKRRRGLRRLAWMFPLSSAARDIEIAHRTARWAAASPSRHADTLKLIEALADRKPVVVQPAISLRAPCAPSKSPV